MPAGDRTGPWGRGPMSGRGLGLCGGYDAPGYGYTRRGRGFSPALPWGRGRGWRNRYYATGVPGWAYADDEPLTAETEKEILRNQSERLKAELESIEKRIQELEQE